MTEPILTRDQILEALTVPGLNVEASLEPREVGLLCAAIADLLAEVCGEPAGWLHVMHMEGGQTHTRLTEDAEDHFGVPGEDYSEEYVVTSAPLFALTRSKP